MRGRHRPLFAWMAIAVLRRVDARTRRQSEVLDLLFDQLQRMETTMADNQNELLTKLSDLAAKVDAYTTERGKELADAVAAAKVAWDKDEQAEHEAALAKIEEIGSKLVTFSASGN